MQYFINTSIASTVNVMVSNIIFATFWAVTITKIISKIIVDIIVFINCQPKTLQK